jgi:hypothetical protein
MTIVINKFTIQVLALQLLPEGMRKSSRAENWSKYGLLVYENYEIYIMKINKIF